MCSCRRRSGASDLQPGWTCQNNAIAFCGNECPIGWPTTDRSKGWGWCRVGIPHPTWNLTSCQSESGVTGTTTVKVLTYNLFWWNLFDIRKGNGNSAGRLIAASGEYDLMGFQECGDLSRILRDAKYEGLEGDFEGYVGGRGIAMAWRTSKWTAIGKGSEDVGEDTRQQYYGKRAVQWARLRHNDGKVVFYVNHHGPLPVSASGGCAGASTSLNILRVIASNAHPDDNIILVGDFNARKYSSRIQELDQRLNRVLSGRSMGGVDHIYSSTCGAVSTKNLGSGGSDHHALNAVFRI